MRKALFLILFLAAWTAMSSAASAGVVSLLASKNLPTENDNIADDSLGFITDANGDGGAPGAGDVAWGIAEIDKVNGTSVIGTAYLVYAAELLAPALGGATLHKESSVANYTLDSLLGVNVLANTGSIAAIVEWNQTGTNPFVTYPFGPGSFILSPATLKADLSTLMANSSLLFAVGVEDPADFFQTSISATDPSTGNVLLALAAGMSVTYVGPSMVAAGFKPLVGAPGFEASIVFGATQVLKGPGTYSASGGDISTYDQGNYNVNYVPEPSSMIALFGLGLAGLAMSLVRRRKS